MHLITVGKLKDKHLEAIEYDYLKRINQPKLSIHEVKASAENRDSEAQIVLKKIESLNKNAFVILMTEFGKEFESPKFSKWLFENLEKNRDVIFVICGAEGPGYDLKSRANFELSLGKFTMPHKLARIILVEQLYRAQTIHTGHPYHN